MDRDTAQQLLGVLKGGDNTPTQPASPEPDLQRMTQQEYAFTAAEKAKEAAEAAGVGRGFTIENWAKEYSNSSKIYQNFQAGIQGAAAKEEVKRGFLSDDEQEKFANVAKGWGMIKQIENSWHAAQADPANPGFGKGKFAGPLNMAQQIQNSPTFANWETMLHTSRPILNQAIMQEGKAQAGEKANVQGFEKNLPSYNDTPESAEAKLDALRAEVANGLTSMMHGYSMAGRGQALAGVLNDPEVGDILKWNSDYLSKQQHPQLTTPNGPIQVGLGKDTHAFLASAANQGTGVNPPTAATNPAGATAVPNSAMTPSPTQYGQQPGKNTYDINSVDQFGKWFQQTFGNAFKPGPTVAPGQQ